MLRLYDFIMFLSLQINLAHFAFANLYVSGALRLLYRARYLLLIVHGENHPLMCQIDVSWGLYLIWTMGCGGRKEKKRELVYSAFSSYFQLWKLQERKEIEMIISD